MQWKNRVIAGEELARKLIAYQSQPDTLVLGLPRGGVVVAHALASLLQLPLDIIVVRKVGAPMNEELAIGAIDETGDGIFQHELFDILHVTPQYLNQVIQKEKTEVLRRLQVYRGNRPPLDLKDKKVIIVDDGIATGATMRVAIANAQTKGAKKIIVATPVLALDTLEKLSRSADEVIYLYAPSSFGAVGQFYEKFEQTSDEEVIQLLHL